MRLWHKDLIPVLPRQQLLGQWRECCAIARNISAFGSPKHVLVNRVMDYPMTHLYTYGIMVAEEMLKRGYKCNTECFTHYFTYPYETKLIPVADVFAKWHNFRYFTQCFCNLDEKHDCGAINDDEWNEIVCQSTMFITGIVGETEKNGGTEDD